MITVTGASGLVRRAVGVVALPGSAVLEGRVDAVGDALLQVDQLLVGLLLGDRTVVRDLLSREGWTVPTLPRAG